MSSFYLKLLKFLGDCLDFPFNRLIFAPFKIIQGCTMSPLTGDFFVLREWQKEIPQHRVGKWKHPGGFPCIALNSASCCFFMFKLYKVMSNNLKRTLDNQKKINEAVEKIFNHFRTESTYAESLQTLADAQSQIIMMMKYVQSAVIKGEEGVNLDVISDFLFDMNEKIKLLKPFANMMGQIYGTEE